MLIHKRLRELLYGVKRFILGKSFLSALVSLTYIIQAGFLGKIVRLLYEKASSSGIFTYIAVIIGLIMLRMLLILFNQYYGKSIIGKIKNTLRKRAFSKLMRLGPGFMIDERSGVVESTVMAGIDYLEGYLSLYIPQILTVFIVSGGIIFYLYTVHFVLASIILVCAFITLVVPYFFLFVIGKFAEEHWLAYTDLSAEFVEGVQGMMTLKAFNASRRFGRNIKAKMQTLFRKTMKSLNLNLLEVGLAGFFTNFGQAFGLAYAAYLCAKGAISLAQMATLFFLISEVFRPLIDLGNYFHQGFMGMTSADGLFSLLDQEETIKNPLQPLSLKNKSSARDITMEDLYFAYDGTVKAVFDHFNVDIKKGEKIAFVSESGSGKTTIVRLLLRFYDPQQGRIKLDGIDLRQLSVEDLRKQYSIVSQDTYLFHGTIRENLLLAKPDAADKELMAACNAANIHDFIIRLPKAYDSKVGEKATNLSGGQRQRIAIARAILKNAPIIILDEATSSVDVENEKDIQDSLDTLLQGKTTITIAHRLSTIQNADRIIVLREGRIVETGKHRELMAHHGYYSELFASQNEGCLKEGA